jgi:O-antigen ligase
MKIILNNTKKSCSNLSNLCKNAAYICSVLIGFSLPISTALDSVLLTLLLLTAIVGWQIKYPQLIAKNPVARFALLLFLMLFVACFYGAANPTDGLKVLTKYDDLILIGLMLPIFSSPKIRLYGQYAFLSAMVITLILSYLIWLNLFENTHFFNDRLPDNPVVFKLHITHGILMGFTAFSAAVYAVYTSGRTRWALIVLSILATSNVLLMTQGRTGYIVIITLTAYFVCTLLNWRKVLLGFGLLMIASTLIYTMSPKIQSRISLSMHEAKTWKPMQGHNEGSSIGTRMDYYTNTIKVIRENPILGVGTGGFEAAYAKEIAGTNMARSNNPHNQFLLFLAQAGVVGLGAFLLLLTVSWRVAVRLPTIPETMLARGIIITISAGCLFNSLLLDHTEGLFFAWVCGLLFAGLPSKDKNL